MCRGSPQQLLGTAAAQAVLTAVGGSDRFGGTPQTPTLPTEGTPGGAGSLTDSTARDHRVVFTETERERGGLPSDVVMASGVTLLTLCRYLILPGWIICGLIPPPSFFQVYSFILHPFSSDLSLHTLPSW